MVLQEALSGVLYHQALQRHPLHWSLRRATEVEETPMTSSLENCVARWQCLCAVGDVLQLLRYLVVIELTLYKHRHATTERLASFNRNHAIRVERQSAKYTTSHAKTS